MESSSCLSATAFKFSVPRSSNENNPNLRLGAALDGQPTNRATTPKASCPLKKAVFANFQVGPTRYYLLNRFEQSAETTSIFPWCQSSRVTYHESFPAPFILRFLRFGGPCPQRINGPERRFRRHTKGFVRSFPAHQADEENYSRFDCKGTRRSSDENEFTPPFVTFQTPKANHAKSFLYAGPGAFRWSGGGDWPTGALGV
jgi:hypothetical protein